MKNIISAGILMGCLFTTTCTKTTQIQGAFFEINPQIEKSEDSIARTRRQIISVIISGDSQFQQEYIRQMNQVREQRPPVKVSPRDGRPYK